MMRDIINGGQAHQPIDPYCQLLDLAHLETYPGLTESLKIHKQEWTAFLRDLSTNHVAPNPHNTTPATQNSAHRA